MTSCHRIIVAIAFVLLAGAARAGVKLPPGFVAEEIARGLTGATAMTIAPDGRLFVCEQTGDVRIWKEGRLLPTPFLTVKVDSYWERGLIGVVLDPAFEKNGFVYVTRSEEHTSELQSRLHLVCRLLLEKKKKTT